MPITVLNNVFHLRSGGSSLLMQVTPAGRLVHLYYGHLLPVGEYSIADFPPASAGPATSPTPPDDDCIDSVGTALFEYPTFGLGDFRPAAFRAVGKDGTAVTDLRYQSHRISRGKPGIPGLPAAYASEEEAETLEIDLKDEVTGLLVTLVYTVFEKLPAIARSVRVKNEGDAPVRLARADSLALDLPESRYDLIKLWGCWAMERTPERTPLCHGGMRISSTRGASSHFYNPFAALVSHGATETSGEAMGFAFVYSGSFQIETEVDFAGQTRLLMGLNPENFSWLLAPGERFDTPEALMVYSDTGIGGMSRAFHKLISRNIIRGPWKDKDRPILVNNWEATYFNFNTEKLLEIGKTAADLGIEMLVMDDGWFGHRENDHSSLGDWYVNEDKLPGGLKALSDGLHRMGLKMGIWVEPEMISPDSDLYRAHPDWALRIPGRPNSPSRWQYVLDMSRKDVEDYVFGRLYDILSSAQIEYVKWDFNRNLSEAGSALLPPERQGEVEHRYMLGVYSLLERVLKAFPDLLLEGCAGGGGRFDAGMLYYSPQFWTSDDTDAIERLTIQEGTSYCYPPSAMSAHVSAVPNHQTGRVTPLKTRGIVAMGGSFGYELDLTKLSDEEKEEVKQQVALYHELAPVIRNGDYYRLENAPALAAWETVSEDGRQVILSAVVPSARITGVRIVRLQGLSETARYRDIESGKVYTGGMLMHAGLNLAPYRLRERDAVMVRLEKVE